MGVDLIQGKLRLALGSMKDQASIGKAMIITHPHGGRGFSNIEVAVIRATGHDQGPVEDKYVHEIFFLVSNLPASVPFLADKISRRLAKTRDTLVAVKTLVLIHRLLRGGNRGFEQGLRNAYFSGHLKLSSHWFRNDNSSDDQQSITFLHNYASYLEERIGWVINQAGKLEPDWSRSKSFNLEFSTEAISLLWRLPRCQDLMERILSCWLPKKEVDGFSSDQNSDINLSCLARTAMSNTLKESFQVHATLSEGIETLVDAFFDLTRESRELACEILKRGSRQSRQLHEMYEECKRVMENKNLEYPKVDIITMDLVVALEQCIGEPRTVHRVNTSRGLPGRRRLGGGESCCRAPALNLFSWRLETKISKIWVVFEEEEINEKVGAGSEEDMDDSPKSDSIHYEQSDPSSEQAPTGGL